jgi:IS30 family transposase
MRNISSLLISISLSRDRSFRSTPKIGHDLAKQPVTIDRNHWSRLSEMTGHDAPKYATTHVERKSRYLIAGKLANKTATETAQVATSAFEQVPKTLRHTLTLDNGKEFARFRDIEKVAGLKIYFADPYSAWQRGTNENTNGLLRRYFPESMGSDSIDIQEKLDRRVEPKDRGGDRKSEKFRINRVWPTESSGSMHIVAVTPVHLSLA